MAFHWEFLLVLALIGSTFCDAAHSKRGEDEDDNLNGDSMPEERYHTPDLYQPSNSLVERAVHRVEQNLERVMQADLKKIEKQVMEKVKSVQEKQMRTLRQVQDTESMRQRNDLLPQGASALEDQQQLQPSEEESPDDTQVADTRKASVDEGSDVPPSSLTEGRSDTELDRVKEDDEAVGDDGLTKKQKRDQQALHASWRIKDNEQEEGDQEDSSSVEDEVAKESKDKDEDDNLNSQVSASLQELSSVMSDSDSNAHSRKAKSPKHHAATSKRKKSIEVDSEGDGMMRRE